MKPKTGHAARLDLHAALHTRHAARRIGIDHIIKSEDSTDRQKSGGTLYRAATSARHVSQNGHGGLSEHSPQGVFSFSHSFYWVFPFRKIPLNRHHHHLLPSSRPFLPHFTPVFPKSTPQHLRRQHETLIFAINKKHHERTYFGFRFRVDHRRSILRMAPHEVGQEMVGRSRQVTAICQMAERAKPPLMGAFPIPWRPSPARCSARSPWCP